MGLAIISGVGTLSSAHARGITTLSVSPTTLGDILILSTEIPSTSRHTNSVSGGGVSSWSQIADPFTTSSGSTIDLWYGVITSTGPSTITVTPSGSVSTTTQAYAAQQFTADGGTATVWAPDGSGGSHQNGTSTTVTFPALTPSGSHRLYFGTSLCTGTGSGAGIAGYTIQLDLLHNPLIYNPDVSTPQTPTAVASSGTSGTVAALIYATNPDTSAFMPFFQ